MGGLVGFLWRGLPAYVWVALLYTAILMISPVDASRTDLLERHLAAPLTSLKLLNGGRLSISWNTVMITAGFIAMWMEVIRSTNIDDTSGNDWLSLLATVAALLIFVGAKPFGTTAFLVVVLVGIGDLLLDRLVGQRVARRDIGLGVG